MMTIQGLFGVGLGMLALTASAGAQNTPPGEGVPRGEIALNYSYMRANATPGQCGCFSLNGGSAEAAAQLWRNLSVVADVTRENTGSTSIAGQGLALLAYTGGPRFSYPLHGARFTRVTPFVQGLAGEVYGFNAPFPRKSGTVGYSANALAVLVGGGFDIAAGTRFDIRALQVDYGLTHLPNNAGNSQNLLRISAGVVLRVR